MRLIAKVIFQCTLSGPLLSPVGGRRDAGADREGSSSIVDQGLSIGFRAPKGIAAFSEIIAAAPSSSGRASPAWDVKIPLILRWARTARLDELREYTY